MKKWFSDSGPGSAEQEFLRKDSKWGEPYRHRAHCLAQVPRSPCREGEPGPGIAETGLGIWDGTGWVELSDQSTGKKRAEARIENALERRKLQREGSRLVRVTPSTPAGDWWARVWGNYLQLLIDLKKEQAELSPQSSQGPEIVWVPISQTAKPNNKQGEYLEGSDLGGGQTQSLTNEFRSLLTRLKRTELFPKNLLHSR